MVPSRHVFRKAVRIMVNVRYLLDAFEDEVRRTDLARGWEYCEGYFELLQPKERYTADRVYLVGTGMTFPKQASADEGAVFVFCDGEDAPVPAGCSGIYLDASLSAVHNAMIGQLSQIRLWSEGLEKVRHGADFQRIIAAVADMGDCFALLVGPKGQITANAHTEPHHQDRPSASMNDIARKAMGCMEAGRPSCFEMQGLRLWCRGVRHQDGKSGILVLGDSSSGHDAETLCRLTAHTLSGILAEESMEAMHEDMQAFCRCWQDIMDERLSTNDEVRDGISRLPYPVDDFVSVGVITFPRRRANVPYRDILLQLRRLFPRENITLYEHDIVILLSQRERSFRPNFNSVDTDHLSQLLKDNDGMMAISSKTRRVDALPSFFLLAKRTALLAAALHDQRSESRIVYYEDYSIYLIIDLAVKRYLQNPKNDDVVYLVHSAIIQLTRYDAEHHTDLRDVLYHYLMCDRNLVKTASATYMHRNTVLNKINKITGMLDLDLEDPNLRQKLILSCQVILYIERAMGRSLNL